MVGAPVTTALVLGGADTLPADVAAYRAAGGRWDGVVACNDAIVWWPEALDAGVSLHCRYFDRARDRRWRTRRLEAGYPDAPRWFGHAAAVDPPEFVTLTDYELPGQVPGKSGSSGLFAAKVALIDLGFDEVVFCGVPMTPTPHIPGTAQQDAAWRSAEGFRRQWFKVEPAYLARMRSMSGWTRETLGAPDILTRAA